MPGPAPRRHRLCALRLSPATAIPAKPPAPPRSLVHSRGPLAPRHNSPHGHPPLRSRRAARHRCLRTGGSRREQHPPPQHRLGRRRQLLLHASDHRPTSGSLVQVRQRRGSRLAPARIRRRDAVRQRKPRLRRFLPAHHLDARRRHPDAAPAPRRRVAGHLGILQRRHGARRVVGTRQHRRQPHHPQERHRRPPRSARRRHHLRPHR